MSVGRSTVAAVKLKASEVGGVKEGICGGVGGFVFLPGIVAAVRRIVQEVVERKEIFKWEDIEGIHVHSDQ